MTKQQWLGILRHLLTGFGGYAVAQGWVSESLVPELVGAALLIVGTAWSAAAPEKR